MLSWQIGVVKITCVVETIIPFPEGSLLRDATAEALKTSPSPWLFPHFAKEDGHSSRPSRRCSWRRRG
jgi:hypothetical protein